MSTTPLQAIEAAAMQLSPQERTDLAERLWLSVADSDEHEAAWDAEIRRRSTELERGEVVTRPWGDVMQELSAKYG